MWIFAIVLLASSVDAQNLGFEEGLAYWSTSSQSTAFNVAPVPTAAWSSEGNNSLLFGGTDGFHHLGFVRSTANHTTIEVRMGDTVCLDYKKNGTFGTIWNFHSTILGAIKNPVIDGTFADVCLPALASGKLSFIVEGNPQSCGSPCQNTKLFMDNIRVYACDDGTKNGFESDVDCGGACQGCDNGKHCASNADCASYLCFDYACAASSFMHANNFNFEQGLNTYWTFDGQQGGAAITSGVSSGWSSEGKYSYTFSRNNGGIAQANGQYVNATHVVNISAGDVVCLDLRKHSDAGGGWRVRLGTSGTFLSPPIINGVYNNTCATSSGNGQLSVVVEGAVSQACSGVACFGNFSFDNVTINKHLCNNGILDDYETSIDCGGFCGQCAPEEDLLATYAPVLYFHPDEQFFPTTIEAMLNESDLKHIVEWEEDPIDDALPVDVLSLDGRNETYYLDMRSATAGYLSISPDPERFDIYPRNIYGRQLNSGNFIVVQYWFFYPFNDFRGGHEGDWEMIQLLLSNETKEPKTATYSYHYEARTYNWSEVNKIDTHPKVFVALGGHASYKDDESIWEKRVVTQERVESEEGSNTFSIPISKISEKDTWTNYKGRWGQWDGNNSFFTGPNSPANLAYGNQPNRWNDPIAFAEHSRPSQISASTGSPVNLHAYDSQGKHTGINEQGEIETEIPGTYLYVSSDNGKEVIVILSDDDIRFIVEATGVGAFNLSVDNYERETDSEIKLAYNDVQIINNTIVTLNVAPTNPNFILQVDDEGDGEVDFTTAPDEKIVQGEPVAQEEDNDNDGLADSIDNCPTLYNPNQNTDFDGDGYDNILCGGDDCSDNDATINPSAPETCDNIDNNCNSQIDENLFFTFGTDVGACKFGIQTCTRGSYEITTPAVNPSEESCNAVDDDCDAFTDEELYREFGIDVGECEKGTESCNNGNWEITIQDVGPTIEICNGKDDNCDGEIDDVCARNTKLRAIELLEDAKNGIPCGNKRFCLDNVLSKVIDNIQKSLDAKYFVDDDALNPEKGKNNGENVFTYEIQAVKACLRGKWLRSIDPICENVADLLAAADQKFAETALNGAKETTLANSKNQKCFEKELSKAEKFLTRAENVISENFPRVEILNYKKSWEHSQKAMEIAQSQKREC